MATTSDRSKLSKGDRVFARESTYNSRGDKLSHMRGVIVKFDRSGVMATVRIDKFYRMKELQHIRVVDLGRLLPKRIEVTEFEYRCIREKCGHVQWVKGIGPIEGHFRLGSDADFCQDCGRMSVRHTGLRRTVFSRPKRGVVEVLESQRTFKVDGHTWCGGVSHSIWDQAEGAERAGKHGLWPLEGSEKVLGPGAIVRVTMVTEVLKEGERQKTWCELGKKKCRGCRTNTASPGKMHVRIVHGYGSDKDYNLCGKPQGSPSSWKDGDDFVTPNDIDRADCKACLAEWEVLEAKRKRELRDLADDELLPKPSKKVIWHVLLHGLPLCGFSKDVPGKWPKGNRWVGFEDKLVTSVPDCQMCVKEYARIKADRKKEYERRVREVARKR